MSKHNDFICSPVIQLLKDAIYAASGVGTGIETYPLYEYVMQSIFLQMVGHQEQKLKYISWEIATHDYDYRYKKSNSFNMSYSRQKDKQALYKVLREASEKQERQTSTTANDLCPWQKATDQITKLYKSVNPFGQKEYNDYLLVHKNIEESSKPEDLFSESMKEVHAALYNHRNRIAHNTRSYQSNLPTLKRLTEESYQYENFFLYFALLVTIDEIFMRLYTKYLGELELQGLY